MTGDAILSAAMVGLLAAAASGQSRTNWFEVERVSSEPRPVSAFEVVDPARPVIAGLRLGDLELPTRRTEICGRIVNGRCVRFRTIWTRSSEFLIATEYENVGAGRLDGLRLIRESAAVNTIDELRDHLEALEFRPVDLEYVSKISDDEFAVLAVPNTGADRVEWVIRTGLDANNIEQLRPGGTLAFLERRVVDFDILSLRESDGSPIYITIEVDNSAFSRFRELDWRFHTNLTKSGLAALGPSGRRIVDFEVRPSQWLYDGLTRYDAITVPWEGGDAPINQVLSTYSTAPGGVIRGGTTYLSDSEQPRARFEQQPLFSVPPLTAGYRIADKEHWVDFFNDVAVDATIIDNAGSGLRAVRQSLDRAAVVKPIESNRHSAYSLIDAVTGESLDALHDRVALSETEDGGPDSRISVGYLALGAWAISTGDPDEVLTASVCGSNECPVSCPSSGVYTVRELVQIMLDDDDRGAAEALGDRFGGAAFEAFYVPYTSQVLAGGDPLSVSFCGLGVNGTTQGAARLYADITEGRLTSDPVRQGILEDIFLGEASPALQTGVRDAINAAWEGDESSIPEFLSSFEIRERSFSTPSVWVDNVAIVDVPRDTRRELRVATVSFAVCEGDSVSERRAYTIAVFAEYLDGRGVGDSLVPPLVAAISDLVIDARADWDEGCDLPCELDLAGDRGLDASDVVAALIAIDAGDAAFDYDADGSLTFLDVVEHTRRVDGLIGFGCTAENNG